jgi:GNAT superfamily N-acetyltransferase
MVAEETAVDYALTARLATEAFADDKVQFSPDRIQWLYERSFGQGTTVLAALKDGQKIGQIALIGQKVCVAGEARSAVQLVDLFIMQAHRSAGLVRKLYREVERICETRGIRYILALPNDKSVLLNARFLKLNPVTELPIRAGVSLLQSSAKLACNDRFKTLSREQAIALFSPFACGTTETGVHYDGESLFNRLDDPTRDYAVHATDALLLVSSLRKRKNVSHTVLCGFFARPHARLIPNTVNELVRAACGFWNSPLFVYAGANDRLPKLPGLPLPARVRRPILVQLRDMASDLASDPATDAPEARFTRFQLIDSDFA